MPTISDASPLIALAAIGRLELLSALFESVLVPTAVAIEVSPSIPKLPAWIHVQALRQPQPTRIERSGLGRGERDALSLCLELQAERLICDDRPARQLAETMGLRVIGTLGVLLAAKRRGILERVRPAVEDLRDRRFFMGSALYQRVLRLAQEADE